MVLGPAKFQGVLYGSGMYPNIWNQSVQGLLSQSKENCLSNWFSHSPLSSPRRKRSNINNENNNNDDDDYDDNNENENENDKLSENSFQNDNEIDLKNYKNIYENQNRKNDNMKMEKNGRKNGNKSFNQGINFLSWVELDRVPSTCQGVFSMSVSVCAPVVPGPEKLLIPETLNQLEVDITTGNGSVKNEEDKNCIISGKDETRSIILWKVVVENDKNTKKENMYGRNNRPVNSDKNSNYSPTSLSARLFGNDDKKNKNNQPPSSIFSLSNFLNSKISFTPLQLIQNKLNGENQISTPPVQSALSSPVLTFNNENKNELNLNLKQEKEENIVKNNNSAKNSPKFKIQDPEEMSDCRVYRFEWTDGMFDIAFQGLKNIPCLATNDYLTKFY